MMNYQIEYKFQTKYNQKINRMINRLNKIFTKSKEKVAYYYENMKTKVTISYNAEITFYAASTIKILAVLYLYQNKIDLKKRIELTEADKKGGSGILKDKPFPQNITLKELAMYSLKYSDNTAYIKLVDFIGVSNLKEFGHSLKASHTLEGKDSFGIINCSDLKCYWESLYQEIKKHPELKDWLEEPSSKIIEPKSLKQVPFIRKYGSFDIAFHECDCK